MKNAFLTLIMILTVVLVKAQTVFIQSAKITFEKKINQKQQLADNDWISDDAKDKMSKYRTSNWEYHFNDSTSIYRSKPKETLNDSQFFFFSGENTSEIFTDFSKKSRVLRKPINGEDFILKDTIPHLKWKIMHDVRKIAGYECRKAIAIINDTVSVVAFYTDEILLHGGPEGFTGLPGMILGLAIPRYNTTWFATKIEAKNVQILAIAAPTKGKKTDNEKDFKKLIDLYTRYDDKKKPRKTEDIKKEIYNLLL
ncbi:GLPGLI family protein [Pedobacter sp. HDW13]|uniref:GLPGLI family protein n=1 Tax=unclassified Pedobacter TaxID=2628915 RepID=UPI000F59E0AE|nr:MULTISPECIES: GLPGLI family protein [unclassified Pedobacter]QIL41718.1 GLPGLI family protein [Pedobacter sp. HDW13]RQO73501.1 GLPGLI family protein [Pedobacter sp. KBW01]